MAIPRFARLSWVTVGALAVGALIGVTVAVLQIRLHDSRFRENCESQHGTVSYSIRWYNGPALTTICARSG
jgi:hypothetical protein